MPSPFSIASDTLEFAPQLLALQEHPPAKLPRVVLLSSCFLLILWACVGKLDVIASAEGRLVPQTYVKIVQPADAGIVKEILVTEGQAVEAGQILMRMDSRYTDADAHTLKQEFELKALQLRRIDAELANASMARQEGDSATLYSQVSNQYHAHRSAYETAMAQEQALQGRARAELAAALEQLQKLRQTLPIYRRSSAAFEQLGKDGFFSAVAVEEKQREHIEKEQDLLAQEATVASLRAQVLASEKKLQQIQASYRSELQNERVETHTQFRKLQGELEKLEHKGSLLALRAPQAGIIKDLSTHTVGTVVAPGAVLMSLVPDGEALQAEVLVKNEDVGFVHLNQKVKIKLMPYPFQKYGMVSGTVVHLGPDASDAPAPSAPSTTSSRNADKPASPGYRALVQLDHQHLSSDGKRLALNAGMQVVAEVHQGQRTVLEYLLSPVQKAWHEAARER